jgi:hypothetical protein
MVADSKSILPPLPIEVIGLTYFIWDKTIKPYRCTHMSSGYS